MTTLRLLISDSYDPRFNSGGRGVHFPPDARHPARAAAPAQTRIQVIGRAQNPWKECVIRGVWKKIPNRLARRSSARRRRGAFHDSVIPFAVFGGR